MIEPTRQMPSYTVHSSGVAILATGPAEARWNPQLVEQLARLVDAMLEDERVRAAVLPLGSKLGAAELDAGWLYAATDPAVPNGDALADEIASARALARKIKGSSKPIVAMLDGCASGPVAELALLCRTRVAAESYDTRLLPSLARLGLPPLLDLAGNPPGASLAREYSVYAAQRAGLIEAVVPSEQLAVTAERLALEAVAAGAAPPEPPSEPTGGTAIQQFVERARESGVRAMLGTLGVGVSDANRLRRRPEGIARRQFSRVGVLGAGLMGSGIAYTCARAGMEVLLVDVDVAAADRGLAALARQEAAAIAAGREEAVYSEARLRRIRPAEYADLATVDIIVEAVFEDRDVKALCTSRAEAVIPNGCLFATNTSTLPITGLAHASQRPDRFIGLHFFSPVPRMPLLEIICGEKTSQATLAEALDFAQAIGKTPIVVKDRRGFFTSRVIMTYQSEAFAMLAEGVAPESIESAGKASGMPLPPLALSDVVALDLIHQINVQTRRDTGATGEPTRAQAVVARMVEEFGRMGKKNSKGFYDYHPDGTKALWPELADVFRGARAGSADIAQLRDRLLGIQALEAFRCLDEGVISDPVEGDVGAVLGWNFPAATGGPLSYIDGLGVGPFVANCDSLAAELGDRFSVPSSLRRMAAEGRAVREGIH